MTEVPVSAPRSAGGQWSGIVDLLVELEDGRMMLIDHKSRPIPAGMASGAAKEFAGQIGAYREVLRDLGVEVESSWVHFPLAGVVVQVG